MGKELFRRIRSLLFNRRRSSGIRKPLSRTELNALKKLDITYNEETGKYEYVQYVTKRGNKLILNCDSPDEIREIIDPMLKGKFTAKWLPESMAYYYPLFSRWGTAESKYFKRNKVEAHPNPLFSAKTLEELLDPETLSEIESLGNESRALTFRNCGISEINYIHSSINSLNRGFYILLESAEPLAAMPLIRLQLDNLTYLAAELKHPFRVLYKVYFKNKRLSQIQVKGKNLNPATIRKELDEQRGWNVAELYDSYSSYVHPDQKQLEMDKYRFMKSRVMKTQFNFNKSEMKRLTKDMVEVNRMIVDLIKYQIAELK